MNNQISITVGELLKQTAQKYPNDVAVKYTDRDYKRTWKEFDDEVEHIIINLEHNLSTYAQINYINDMHSRKLSCDYPNLKIENDKIHLHQILTFSNHIF